MPVEDAEQCEPDLPTTVNLINLEKCLSDYSSDELNDIGEEFGPSITSPLSQVKVGGVVRSITQKL